MIIPLSCEKTEHAERLHELAYEGLGGLGAEMINGYGNTAVAATRQEGLVLYIYEYDPSNSDQLNRKQELNLDLPDYYRNCVSLEVDSLQMVVAATEYSGDDDGIIGILRKEYDGFFHLKTTYKIPYIPKLSCLNSNVLFTCSSDSLYLYDIGSMNELQLIAQQHLEYTVKRAYTCEAGFFLTTDVGFGVVDIRDWDDICTSYSVNEHLSDCNRGIKYENKLYLGGPHNAAFIKILKVDISDPFNPKIEKSKKNIEGQHIHFTYDKHGNYFAFSEDRVFKYTEISDGFKLIGLDQLYYGWNTFYYSIDSHIYGNQSSGITYFSFR